MAKRNVASVGFIFLLAAALFVLAAVVPTFGGRPLNAAFLGIAVVFFVLGVVTKRKSGGSSGSAGA